MSKKRQGKKTGKTPQKQRAEGQGAVPPIDPRSLEKEMSNLVRRIDAQDFESVEDLQSYLDDILADGQIPDPAPKTPLDQAQDLVYAAWDATGGLRVTLAYRALGISKDCADAYVLLAEEAAKSLEEAKTLYAEGVKAGERALGDEVFENDVGHFWGLLSTRPYMRALRGLADCLWMLGDRKEAIAHYVEMLRLNPGDNQGIRYTLVLRLLEEGADEELEQLLERYEEDISADWMYARALYMFRREGADSARSSLKEALETNPFVPNYLLGRKRLPKRMPNYIGFGDEREAVSYAAAAQPVWEKTPGALAWLAREVRALKKGG